MACSQNALSTRLSNIVTCCVKRVRKNNTPEISSDVSEVFVWSASEMCLTPDSPIWLPVV